MVILSEIESKIRLFLTPGAGGILKSEKARYPVYGHPQTVTLIVFFFKYCFSVSPQVRTYRVDLPASRQAALI